MSARTPCAWVIDLAADEELAFGQARTPSRALAERLSALRTQAAQALLREGDVLVESQRFLGPMYQARAWCPTASARARFKQAGLTVPPQVSLDTLAKVTARSFCLPDEAVILTADTLSALPHTGGPWRLSRMHTVSGRGHARCETHEQIRSTFARLAGAQGQAVLAPWHEVTEDFGLHGFVSYEGTVTLGEPTQQHIDRRSLAWLGTVRCAPGTLGPEEHLALFEAAQRCALKLTSAGYFGPFGLDAYRYRDPQGRTRFCALGELNARYTMGWAVGMGAARPAGA
ncbi:MAG: hypothetical protein Q8Q09_07940 [Deltaproteobacteria bacterium]|nr:hypothetical protein [Deltaproteobacteria bacterium]